MPMLRCRVPGMYPKLIMVCAASLVLPLVLIIYWSLMQQMLSTKYKTLFKCLSSYRQILLSAVREMAVETRKCIFCEIIYGKADATIVYKDDMYIAFKDIRPVSDNHFLVVPQSHIQDVKSLSTTTTNVVEEMVSIGKKIVIDKSGDINDCRMGFHWPPFNSIKHLHLHVIFPESRMTFLGRQIYRPNTFYFATPEVTIEWLNKHNTPSA